MADFPQFFVFFLIFWQEIQSLRTVSVLEVDDPDFSFISLYGRDFYEGGAGYNSDKPGIVNTKDNYNEYGKIDKIGKEVDDLTTEKFQTEFPHISLYGREFYEGGSGDNSDNKPGIMNTKDNYNEYGKINEIGKKVDDPTTEKNKTEFSYNFRHGRDFYEGGSGDNSDNKQGMMNTKDNYNEYGEIDKIRKEVDDSSTETIQINSPFIPLRYIGHFYEWGSGERRDKAGMAERDDDLGNYGKRQEWRQEINFENGLHGEANTRVPHGEDAELTKKHELDKIKLDILGILLALYLKLIISTGISSVFLFLGSLIYQLAIFTGTTAVFAEDSVIQFIFKSLSIVEKYL